MRNSCGTKKIIPKANKIVVITGFCLQVSPCLEASGAFRATPDPLSGGAAKPTQPTPPLGLTLGNLGEGGIAAEPDVVDPSPGLGDGGASRASRLSGLIDRSVQGALETNSVRLCGRDCDASGQPR
jgi:hypothetical protein